MWNVSNFELAGLCHDLGHASEMVFDNSVEMYRLEVTPEEVIVVKALTERVVPRSMHRYAMTSETPTALASFRTNVCINHKTANGYMVNDVLAAEPHLKTASLSDKPDRYVFLSHNPSQLRSKNRPKNLVRKADRGDIFLKSSTLAEVWLWVYTKDCHFFGLVHVTYWQIQKMLQPSESVAASDEQQHEDLPPRN
ncbi:hypothetical protein F5141DRAFT_1067484 [Pisolithus sp. B1]|nr:hypothetical protein F5141DRAFT_1067484 [Pisolithus sp. B1]